MTTDPDFTLRPVLRIDFPPEQRLGHGKMRLLELIRETGSISAAGRAMGMSYRRAWLLVDEMNRMFSRPVVESQRGGKQGAVPRSALSARNCCRASGRWSDVLPRWPPRIWTGWSATAGRFHEIFGTGRAGTPIARMTGSGLPLRNSGTLPHFR